MKTFQMFAEAAGYRLHMENLKKIDHAIWQIKLALDGLEEFNDAGIPIWQMHGKLTPLQNLWEDLHQRIHDKLKKDPAVQARLDQDLTRPPQD